MPDLWMDVDAALAEVPVNIMPLLDDTDFKSREESVAYNAAGMELIWHFVTTAGATSATVVTPTTGGAYDWAHQDGGMYTIEIPASGGASINNDTEGFGWFTGKATGVLPWRGPVIGFRAAGLNNALIDSAYSTTRGLAGTALPDAAADAAGGLPISDAGGLDLDAQIGTDIDAILVDTGTTLDTLIKDIPTVAEFEARTLVAADYVVVGDTLAAVTTVGSVTGAVGSVTGAVGSVTGNVGGNVAGSVASVTGNVGGNVVGSVGSVTGAVGSVTGNVGGNVTGSVGSVAAGGITAASIATGAIDADALAADAGAELADAVWDEALAGHAVAGSAGATLSAASAPTAADVADAVWDEAIAGHLGAGTTGASLNAAGAAGDPWLTALPGAYADGTAGDIIGNLVDDIGALTPAVAISTTTAASVSTGALAVRTHHSLSQAISSTYAGNLSAATKLWLAVKAEKDDTDAQSVIFIEATAGLTYLAGAAYTTVAHGSLTVGGSAGAWTITVAIDEVATGLLTAYADGMLWAECKALVGGSTVAVWDGVCDVARGIVNAVA